MGGLVKLGLVLGKESLIDLDLSGGKRGGGDKLLDGVLVSAAPKCDMKENIQGRGCQQACGRARGRASRSCSWTWRKYHSTGGSFSGGK